MRCELKQLPAAAGLCLLVGCSATADNPGPSPDLLPPFDAASCQVPARPTIEHDVATLGPAANHIVVADDHAYIVQSQDNTIGRFDLETETYERNFIDVGVDRNPWNAAVAEPWLYATNLLTSSVSVADVRTGDVLSEISGAEIDAPSAIAATPELVLVANTAFDGEWRDGWLTALRPTDDDAPAVEIVGTVTTSARNPQRIEVVSERNVAIVVSTGEVGFDDATGDANALSDGAIDVFDLATLAVDPTSALIHATPLPRTSAPFSAGPGDIVVDHDTGRAWIASSVAPDIFVLDLDSYELVRDTSSPVPGYVATGNQLTQLALRDDGFMYVVAYNEDALLLYDTSCDATVAGPFDLGLRAGLEGPIDIAWDPRRKQALAAMTITNTLVVIR